MTLKLLTTTTLLSTLALTPIATYASDAPPPGEGLRLAQPPPTGPWPLVGPTSISQPYHEVYVQTLKLSQPGVADEDSKRYTVVANRRLDCTLGMTSKIAAGAKARESWISDGPGMCERYVGVIDLYKGFWTSGIDGPSRLEPPQGVLVTQRLQRPSATPTTPGKEWERVLVVSNDPIGCLGTWNTWLYDWQFTDFIGGVCPSRPGVLIVDGKVVGQS